MKMAVFSSVIGLVLAKSTENQPGSATSPSLNVMAQLEDENSGKLPQQFSLETSGTGSALKVSALNTWLAHLQRLHQNQDTSSEGNSAMRVGLVGDWYGYLKRLHQNQDTSSEGNLDTSSEGNSALRIDVMNDWIGHLQRLHQQQDTPYEGTLDTPSEENSALRIGDAHDWIGHLQRLHQEQDSAGLQPSVKYLESFKDYQALIGAMQNLARSNNASIHVTNTEVFGKPIAKYLTEVVVPNDAILASCHNPEDCELQPETCDERFSVVKKPVDWTPPPGWPTDQTDHPLPFCHSPPSDTHMVYALTEFEDKQTDWLMFACHFLPNHGDMCHVTDMVVADDDILQSIRTSVTLV